MKKKLFILLALITILSMTMIAAAPATGGMPPKPTCGEGEKTLEDAQWVSGHWVFKKICHRHKCFWVPWYYVKGYWEAPVCEVVEKPVCGYNHFVSVAPTWDEELEEWVGLKCRCDLTGMFEYIYTGTGYLTSCILETNKDGGGGLDKIPARFLNAEYVEATCSCVDCDGETPIPFKWDGEKPDVRQQTKCDTYPSARCPVEE